jgi:hypothetical protein
LFLSCGFNRLCCLLWMVAGVFRKLNLGCAVSLGWFCKLNLGCAVSLGWFCKLNLGCAVSLGWFCKLNLGCGGVGVEVWFIC